MKLDNKVALVTGASSGIGRETAKLFAEEGAVVVLAARHKNKLVQVQREIGEERGVAYSYSMDTTKRQQVKSVVKKVISKLKKIDILVNNAGIAEWNPIQKVTQKEFEDHLRINVTGYFNCLKEVLPYMENKKSGCVINIISGSGKRARPGTVAYATSKFAAAGLTEAVFEDVKEKGINVTGIYPGKTNTPIHRIPKNDPKRKKMLNPEEVAKACLYAATLPSNVKVKELSIRPEE